MKRLIFILFAALSAISAQAQTAIKVETHSVVEVGEQFNITFIIDGEEKVTDFQWAPSDGFQVLWGPQSGRSSSMHIVNGKTTRSVQTTYTYVLRANSPGKFQIPPAIAQMKKKEISSRPVTIEVVAGRQPSTQPQTSAPQQSQGQQSLRGGDLILSMTLDRTDVVVGEPVTATIKLYQRVNIAGFEGADFPSFDGFWSQEVETPQNMSFSRETYDGQIYNAALIRKFILVPQHTGILTIEPAELVCLVNVRVSSAAGSIFDGFFDDYRTIRQKAVSKSVTVKVSPLPDGAPASFAGGVGEFSISARLNKDTVKTHEAASLIVTVTGQGNISLIESPKVNFPPDMEVYDTKTSDKINPGGLSGSKVYEFPFIPRSHGDFVIEPVKYSYYDVKTRRYVTLQTAPLNLTVEKGNEVEAGPVVISGVTRKDVKNLGSDIRFINVKTPSLVSKGTFFLGSVMFWVLTALIFSLAALCWLVFRKIATRKADVVGAKNRKATKMALKRLRLAGTFLKQDLQTAFYEELHKALLGFISDKLNMPAAELSRDRISEALKERGVAEASVETFTGLLDACEYARYAPVSGNDAMAAHYNSALEVISTIDSNMKSSKSVSKAAYIVALLLMVPSIMSAQPADSLWNDANNAYVEGKWEDAVAGYIRIADMGLESAALYCNTGDAYFKAGNVAKAILYYERALKLDPSYEDARYNLELLNGMIQDRIEPVPEFILKVWMRDICWLMDSDSWAVAFLVLLALTLAMLLMFLLSPSVAGRRTGFFTGIVLLLFAVSSLSFSIWQKNDYMDRESAVVMCPVASVKSSPSAESAQDLFVLHEGTKVGVIDRVGGWNNIRLADGRQGWIRAVDIESI